MSTELKALTEDIHSKFAELKETQREIAREETKKHVDVLLTEKLHKINDAITQTDDRLEKAEKLEALMRVKNEVCEKMERSDLDKAFLQFIRSEKSLESSQRKLIEDYSTKSMNSLSDTAGGYLVVPYMDTAITTRLYELSPMRSVCQTVNISTDQYKKPQQTDLAAAQWLDRDSTPVNTAEPTFGQLSIRVNKLYAMPEVSEDLLADSFVDVVNVLADSISTAFDLAEGQAFINGNGSGQPKGLLTANQGNPDTWGNVEVVPSGAAADLTYAGLVNLVASLKNGYAANGRFLMNRSTIAKVRLLVDSTGRSLWMPQLGSANPAEVLGYPVIQMAHLPNVAAGTIPIVFGDFRRAYIVVDRAGITMLRDPYTHKPFVSFYTTKRVGASYDNTESFKYQKISVS